MLYDKNLIKLMKGMLINLKEEELIKEYGIDFAIEEIAQRISEKIRQYKESKNTSVQKELITLLKDREKIYDNDITTIKKYVKKMENK